MRWKDVSEKSRDWMVELGAFHPIRDPKEAAVKGWLLDYNVSGSASANLSSTDLREIATACIEVADWLDKRAAEAKGE